MSIEMYGSAFHALDDGRVLKGQGKRFDLDIQDEIKLLAKAPLVFRSCGPIVSDKRAEAQKRKVDGLQAKLKGIKERPLQRYADVDALNREMAEAEKELAAEVAVLKLLDDFRQLDTNEAKLMASLAAAEAERAEADAKLAAAKEIVRTADDVARINMGKQRDINRQLANLRERRLAMLPEVYQG